jgi:hypothetical protein
MPIGALGACLIVGYSLSGAKNKKQTFSPKLLEKTLNEEGLNLGWFSKIFNVMVKFITPVLIIVVEIFGVVDIIFAKNKAGVREFSSNGLWMVVIAYLICGIAVAIYFTFLKNKETGENADELELEKSLIKTK